MLNSQKQSRMVVARGERWGNREIVVARTKFWGSNVQHDDYK